MNDMNDTLQVAAIFGIGSVNLTTSYQIFLR